MDRGEVQKIKVPGYTGYVPAYLSEDYTKAAKKSPSKRIPGYQGFVPAISAENIYGTTFGKITEAVGKGQVIKGTIPPAEEHFKSIHMTCYSNPRDKRISNPLSSEDNAREVEDATRIIPEETLEKFWGSGAYAGAHTDTQVKKQNEWSATLQKRKK